MWTTPYIYIYKIRLCAGHSFPLQGDVGLTRNHSMMPAISLRPTLSLRYHCWRNPNHMALKAFVFLLCVCACYSETQCPAGWSGANGGTCTECPAKQYKTGTGPGPCLPCLSDSSSLAGSTMHTDCKCNAGWTGPDGVVQRATYKGELAEHECTALAYGTYTEYNDLVYNGARVYAKPAPNVRYLWKYKEPGREEYVITSVMGDRSTAYAFWFTNALDIQDLYIMKFYCGFATGWRQLALIMYPVRDRRLGVSTCVQCPAGNYKAAVGDAACLPCSQNSVSVAGSSDCLCIPGWTAENGPICAPCPTDHYKPLHGHSACVPCSEGSFSAAGSTANTDCQCLPGWTGETGAICTLCPANQHKSLPGPSLCLPCEFNQVSVPGSTDCRCPHGTFTEPPDSSITVVPECIACQQAFHAHTITTAYENRLSIPCIEFQ